MLLVLLILLVRGAVEMAGWVLAMLYVPFCTALSKTGCRIQTGPLRARAPCDSARCSCFALTSPGVPLPDLFLSAWTTLWAALGGPCEPVAAAWTHDVPIAKCSRSLWDPGPRVADALLKDSSAAHEGLERWNAGAGRRA